MRCLVTGASGHLGSCLTRLLLERGHSVVGLVHGQSNLWRISDLLSQVPLIHADLAKIDQARASILTAAPEIAFHTAWHGVTSEFRNDLSQINCNLVGSLRLLQIAQEAGVKCWVGIGSQAEFGSRAGILREDSPTHPVTLYGSAKLCTGLLSRRLCAMAGTRYLWFRLLATYGPKGDPHYLIPSVILKLLARERPALTRGEQWWDYLYVEDAAEAIYQAALKSEAQGSFILASGDARRVRDIVETIRDLIDPALALGLGEIADGPEPVAHLRSDITKLKQATGWAPRVSLEEGLKRTVAWHRLNLKNA